MPNELKSTELSSNSTFLGQSSRRWPQNGVANGGHNEEETESLLPKSCPEFPNPNRGAGKQPPAPVGSPSLESNLSFARPGEEEKKSLIGKAFEDSASGSGRNPSPEGSAGLLSQVFFSYCDSLIKLGRTKHLEQGDLWDLLRGDLCETVHEPYERLLKETANPVTAPQGSIMGTLTRMYGRDFFFNGVLKVIHDLIMFTPPYILERILKHEAQPHADRGVSFGLALAMFAAAVAENLTVNIYFHQLYRMSLHIKVNMITMLYDKSLRITSGVKAEMGVGSILNLQSNDASKIWNLPMYLHIVWNGPFQIFIIMAMLARIMGWASTLAGLAVTVIMIPLSTLVGKALGTSRREMLKHTDARVKLSTEIVTGIKAIKMYAWEDAYSERISDLREKELRQVRRTQLLSSLNSAVFMSGPVLVGLAAFGVYTAEGKDLTASVAFPALALFNLLRFPIIMFPNQIMSLINARIGLQRIQKFMAKEETASSASAAASEPGDAEFGHDGKKVDVRAGADALLGIVDNGDEVELAVQIKAGTFSWDSAKEPVLKNVSVSIFAGQLVMIVGQVGCGKSSFLMSLLGEMHRKSGVVKVVGSVALTAQDPWIQNSTLRNNILMGESFEEEAYIEVLAACALVQDLEMLAAGDASEIGEKGINLSGGQKHRVALARAAYAAADVYLLDDPLSAVDAHVGRHIFDQCICGLLGYSTRVLVTHQLQYLPAADVVVVMSEGCILDVGTYDELVERGVDLTAFASKGEDVDEEAPGVVLGGAKSLQQLLPAPSFTAASSFALPSGTKSKVGFAIPEEEENNLHPVAYPGVKSQSGAGGSSVSISKSDRSRLVRSLSLRKEDGKVVRAEERAVGRVQRSVYYVYIKAWSSAFFWVPITVLVMAFAERGLQVGQNFVLAKWSNAVAEAIGNVKINAMTYLSVYFILGGVSILCQLLRSIMAVFGSIASSQQLYRNLQSKIVRLPMSFFDSQPTGRLLNRFTKDTEAIDLSISGVVAMTLTTTVAASLSIIVILVVAPLSIVALLPLAYVYYRVQSLYLASSRELKRLDSLAFSPIFSHFSETLHGLVSIRAFGKKPLFQATNVQTLDSSNRAWWPAQVVNRWLSVRLEMMGAAVVFSATFFVTVVMPRSPGMVGLVITSALNLTGILNWMVRQVTELEINMNSVERVTEYDKLPEEAASRSLPGKGPPMDWPTEGAISVQRLEVRYRPDLDLVLRGLSFEVRGREKVGVCGRTGCGKSTLFLALYRIVEPSEGRIIIDGIDVSTIGLSDLRSRLSLVPQDPVIFSGTVRSNLDPFGQVSSDAAIWEALTRAGSDGFVRELEKGLDSPIKEGGANVSVGQRQLLCMARALLRSSRILVLDEATSNVDNTTDGLIQATIRTAFRDCTVLTIAHRLHTIVDSDRILLLDAGEKVEFDTPGKLLRDPHSAFRKLVDETMSGGGLNQDVVSRVLSEALERVE